MLTIVIGSMSVSRSLGEEDRGSGVILEYDYESSALNLFSKPGFMIPGQVGLALDTNGDLFMDNAASDPFYGGRMFRVRGATSPGAGQRDFIGSVNYYSLLLQFAHPTMVQQLAFGYAVAPGETDSEAALFIADANDNVIKTIFLFRC